MGVKVLMSENDTGHHSASITDNGDTIFLDI